MRSATSALSILLLLALSTTTACSSRQHQNHTASKTYSDVRTEQNKDELSSFLEEGLKGDRHAIRNKDAPGYQTVLIKSRYISAIGNQCKNIDIISSNDSSAVEHRIACKRNGKWTLIDSIVVDDSLS